MYSRRGLGWWLQAAAAIIGVAEGAADKRRGDRAAETAAWRAQQILVEQELHAEKQAQRAASELATNNAILGAGLAEQELAAAKLALDKMRRAIDQEPALKMAAAISAGILLIGLMRVVKK